MATEMKKGTVAAWQDTVVMPTYVPPPPDPNPMYLERRVNQGTRCQVYPNPFTDRLSNEREDRPYQAVFLENDYLRLMILPEIGGRIQVEEQGDTLVNQELTREIMPQEGLALTKS